MKRIELWPVLLMEFFAARSATPFAWGTNDCVTYAADAVRAITGDDPLADLRGSWSTELGARRAVTRAGGMPAALDSRFTRLPNVLCAQRGDIGVLPEETGWHVVVVCMGALWACPGPDGVVTVSLEKAAMAWAVGR